MRTTITRGSTLAAIVTLIVALAAALTGNPAATSGATAAEVEHPNVVFILTDDMRADDLAHMPRTRRLIGGYGTTYTDAISPHPLCCPARAELLTGQYAHNNGVRHNSGEYGGWDAFKGRANTLGAWFREAGYRTGFVGKLMNGYRGGDMPGWNSFDPYSAGVYRPYRFTSWGNGNPVQHPRDVHTTDYTTDKTVRWVEKFARKGDPFFVFASYTAPHRARSGTVSAPPRATGEHADTQPTFGTPDDTLMVDLYRQRLDALEAVDQGVRDTVRALRRTGELDNTLIVFTSDNGFMLGEGGLTAKNHPQEGSVAVPLLMRGPGVPTATKGTPASLVDLPATMTTAANVTPGRTLDGADLLADDGQPPREATLIQAGDKVLPWSWRGVRTPRFTYVTYFNGRDAVLWDRGTDPYQRVNVADDPCYADDLVAMRAYYAALKDCEGEACATGPVAAQ